MKLLAIALLPFCAFAADTVTIFEINNAIQTGRPISFGRPFVQGEFPAGTCPQPTVGGTPIAGGSWQFDLRNSWADGSVKYGVVSLLAPTLAASGSVTLGFVAGTCSNSGLSKAAMVAYSPAWGADIEVTANATTQTADAATMLNALSIAYCGIQVELQGPVVTQVLVEDCSAATAYDFGWTWNGTTMSSPVTGNATTASLHPKFRLRFFGTSGYPVEVESIVENMWTTRMQDQKYSVVLKTGSPLSSAYTHSTFTQIGRTVWKKHFYSGTALGNIRIDHNWPYLISTKMFPNYDLSIPANGYDPTVSNSGGNGITSYSEWVSGDKAELGGAGNGGLNSLVLSVADDSEGAPDQREPLLYLYNMSTAGTANGLAAKAWQMLTAESGANDTSLTSGNISGGAGTWAVLGWFPIHNRELRTSPLFGQTATNYYYCPSMADKDSIGGTGQTCGGSATVGGYSNSAIGRNISQHTHPGDQWTSAGGACGQVSCSSAAVGTLTDGNWIMDSPNCAHWIDFDYEAYILTGNPYYRDEMYQGAAWCFDGASSGQNVYNGNYFFTSPWGGNTSQRALAWAILQASRAAAIAPDGGPEQLYFKSLMDSQFEMLEGMAKVTGTALTPSSTICTGASVSGYNYTTANRFNWGSCTLLSQCLNTGTGTCSTITNALHMATMGTGYCPADPTYVNATFSVTTWGIYHHWWQVIADQVALDLGFSEALPTLQEEGQHLLQMTLDGHSNPWLMGAYNSPVQAGSACTGNFSTDPFLSSWTNFVQATATAMQPAATFDSSGPLGTFPGTDHAYALSARAAGSTLVANAITSSDANCPSGTCTASAAWNWLNGHVPYFNLAVSGSTTLTSPYFQLKYALAPRLITTTAPLIGPGTLFHE